jgi:hypothetical protein
MTNTKLILRTPKVREFGCEGRVGVLKLKRFEFRVPAHDEPIGRELRADGLGRVGYGLKYCKLNAAAHDSQLVTRNKGIQHSSTPR